MVFFGLGGLLQCNSLLIDSSPSANHYSLCTPHKRHRNPLRRPLPRAQYVDHAHVPNLLAPVLLAPRTQSRLRQTPTRDAQSPNIKRMADLGC